VKDEINLSGKPLSNLPVSKILKAYSANHLDDVQSSQAVEQSGKSLLYSGPANYWLRSANALNSGTKEG
jgi:hypothetical protein